MIPLFRLLQAGAAATLLLGLCPAQDPAPEKPAQPYGPPRATSRKVFDKIVFFVGDQAVLASTIDRELEANIQGREVPPELQQKQRAEIIRQIIHDEIWVQRGKVLGKESPDVFDEFVERSVDEKMAEMVDDFGSWTRTVDELNAIGSSWGETRADYRKQLLSQIAKQQVLGQRFGANWSLMVTPEEMRQYFDEHLKDYGAKRRISVARIFFSLNGKDQAEVTAQAETAAATWRREPVDAKTIAKRFGGTALNSLQDVRPEDPKDPNQPYVKSFAAESKAGQVSDPIRHGDRLWLLRVTRKVDRAAKEFGDQEVQEQIRGQLSNKRYMEFQARMIEERFHNLVYFPED